MNDKETAALIKIFFKFNFANTDIDTNNIFCCNLDHFTEASSPQEATFLARVFSEETPGMIVFSFVSILRDGWPYQNG